MAQDYDKILKENMEELILPLSDKLLDLSLGPIEELPNDLQNTLERKPDLLKRVRGDKRDASYLLHIEFQVKDETTMVDRMLLYYAMLWEKYHEPVKQYVVFIGRRKPKMPTALQSEMLNYRFTLVDIRELNYRNLLNTATQPEEAVLAILSNFKKSEADTVIPEILRKLQKLAGDERKLRRYVRQIEILANLRNLQLQVIKHTETMALTYNIETDVRYQQGIEKGIEKKEEEMIVTMLQSGLLTDEQIAEMADTSLAHIQRIKKTRIGKHKKR